MFGRKQSSRDDVRTQEEFLAAKKRLMMNQARFYEASKRNAYLRNQIASRETYRSGLEEKKAELRALKAQTASARDETAKIEEQIEAMRLDSDGDMDQIKHIVRSLNVLELEKRHTTERLHAENDRLADHLDKQIEVIQALVKQLKAIGEKPNTGLDAVKNNKDLVVEKAGIQM
mmetsp:Transcript_5854/g.15577  ORF Transcript_5854/g.15577 Transcript_5854/m.15577 type:complete len:174 (+) Transcript_5854:85-606(+)